MMGGGVGVLDFVGDGWFDVYVSQGGRFPPLTNQSMPFGDRLFRNRGDGTFEDATERSGLARFSGGYGLGVTVGDYDSDGWPDLFVTRWDHYALYRNLADGRFADVTENLGLSGRREWPASAAWGDFDGDRDLDLYVCHYLSWDPAIANEPDNARKGSILETPLRFRSVPDHLFRNDQARFVDVTESSGIHDPDGRGLGVVVADLDGDRRVDIYVANDMTTNFFFRNEGGGRFRECASEVGLAGNSEGGFQASMGIACGDQDGDGRIDLAVTNFYLEATTLYHNLGSGMFADDTRPSMLFATTRTLLGFGTAFLDTNRDGVLDLASANGHIYPGQTDIPFRMPTQLLLGTRGGRFRDVTAISGEALAQPRVGRALVPVDYDNDGRLELILVSLDSPLALFRTESGPSDSTHSVTIVLEGTESNREGIGATVRVVSSGRTFVAQRFGGGSYQSTGDPRLHFGLGNRNTIERVEIEWPSGRTDRFSAVLPDAIYRAKEGSSRLELVIGNDLKK
jgi:hypothetical protein